MVQFNFLQNLDRQNTEPAIVRDTDSEQKEQLINQIKNDIKEIDTKDDKRVPLEDSQTNLKSLSESLKSIFARGDKEEKKEEITNGFSLKSKNIPTENREVLKDNSTTVMQKSEDKMKSILNLDLTEPLIQEEVITQEKVEVIPQQKSEPKIETQTQSVNIELKNLGLTKEDEYDLINDFVNDISVHLKLFKTLISNKNFDQAQYSLIKIRSSAEILNLDAIIISLNGIKEACDSQDELKIKDLNFHLESQVKQLKNYLKNATI